jgi:hypothetical protein
VRGKCVVSILVFFLPHSERDRKEEKLVVCVYSIG